MSSTVHLRNGSTTDSDANDDKQEALAGFDVGSSEQEIHQIEDNNLACSTVVCKPKITTEFPTDKISYNPYNS